MFIERERGAVVHRERERERERGTRYICRKKDIERWVRYSYRWTGNYITHNIYVA